MKNATASLFDHYYFSQPWYVDGTDRFHALIRGLSPANPAILEIGAGGENATSNFLSSIGRVVGLDIDDAVLKNQALSDARIFNGREFPFECDHFDVCVSNYVLEHIQDCELHFKEVGRMLKPGGVYVFRTPNLWHYVTLVSRVTPHSFHSAVANRMRDLPATAHAPHRTFYGANTRRSIKRHTQYSGLIVEQLAMIEAEPSYGAAHALLFYPMMAYERFVNSSRILSSFRANIFGAARKSRRISKTD